MSIRKAKKSILAVALGASLAVGCAAGAQAVTSQSDFNTTVPRFQQSHYWEYQNKTTDGDSEVQFDSIGGGYTMNVKAENGANGNQYTEQTAISTGSSRSIPNSTPPGTATRLIVTNNTWTTVNVSVTGWFKTN